MFSLKAKRRTKFGRKTNILRKQGILPAILYGPEIENIPLEVSGKEFEKIFQEVGESSLILLEIDKKNYEVLIHEITKDPLIEKILHIDFYHPPKTEKITVAIPLVFEKEEEIQRVLSGNLLKEFRTIEVKSLPQNLPKDIKVDLGKLKNIGDKIQVKDLNIQEGVEILKDPEEIITIIVQPEEFKEKKEEKKEEKEEELIQKNKTEEK